MKESIDKYCLCCEKTSTFRIHPTTKKTANTCDDCKKYSVKERNSKIQSNVFKLIKDIKEIK
jgi:hypothetical protein